MAGRAYNPALYRFGFNSKEKDDEVKGTGNQIDFGARVYDSRLGSFLSIDPLYKKFPNESNYSFGGNNPILFIDKDGNKKTLYITLIDESGHSHTIVIVNKYEVLHSVTHEIQKVTTPGGAPAYTLSIPVDHYNDINQSITINKQTGKKGEISAPPLSPFYCFCVICY